MVVSIMKQALAVLAIALLCSPLLAQSATTPASAPKAPPAAAPAFEIADIHPSPYSFASTYPHHNTQGTDRYLVHKATELDMISFAYSLDKDHIFGGPTWLDFDRYDVTARQPPSTPPDTSSLMLRTLLADRFKLVVHNDTRQMPAQILTAADTAKPKMKPAADTTAPSQCQFHPPATPPTPDGPMPTSYSFTCRNITMEQFTKSIPSFGPGGLSIIDQTGLKGAWDFDVAYTMLPARNGFDLEHDLDKQLGLKLTLGQSPQPVLIVDKVNETPTPNSPKIAELLPPPATPAFDVATVKPSPPDGPRDMQIMFMPNGQVNIRGASLQALIGAAYDISGAGIADIPPFLSKNLWDIVGKIAQDDYPKGPNGRPNVSFDDIRLMVRSLLVERFGMKTHFEDRPNDVYVLSASGTPKLKKTADPNSRTSCISNPPAGEKDPRATEPIRNYLMVCTNVTMMQFAHELEPFAVDYIKEPVLDSTHIEGSYDLTLNWSGSRVARGVETINGQTITKPDPSSTDPSEAAAPTGAISLPDAIAKQLGLKMELQKLSVPMLILDHIEENPTEN
jgi:uncharacterized protein (TIGR03435 family)